MKLLCGASLALALGLTLGVKAAADDEVKNCAYFPLQVGATWTYKAGESKFTLKVTDHRKIGTKWCAHIETKQDDKVVGSEDVSAQDDGVYRVATDDKPIEPAGGVLILKLENDKPKNDEWNVNGKVEPKGGGDKQSLNGTYTETYSEDEAKKITVGGAKVPAVTVSCADLVANGAKYSFKSYYVKDKGMVKQEITAGGLTVTLELESYEPGK
jgi:hypothetical protein